ncbi:response regulator transcription factor [Aedoeadaptatus acetigenes]|uniref:response regulator transcription factor n=1 Tax=Aedoeadaptatus acetigenes TaxID=2981723 RepID=UPI0011DCB3C0|nr:response regulator transcription factor [Aedoeadaptatus acetigenes]MCU6786331.1 response regulator transcription factor [Aedoeadaptatus acetigenes]
MKILMIEDDETIVYGVKTYLARYDMEVVAAGRLGDVGEEQIRSADLLILDVNLPDGSGFDFLNWVRSFSKLPILMLTVKGDEDYVVKGLSQGADEYVAKPFSLPVLKARIDNLFKRLGPEEESMEFKELILDRQSKMAILRGKAVDLNRQEFDLLAMLLANRGRQLLRSQLIDEVWGFGDEVNDNTLTVAVKRLRKKLGPYGHFIKTVRGMGYFWEDGDD